ncbi:hypothetical protein NDU88_002003 [Pleurodeles waltl]|uniref:Uncharacterized protein n=1 Tax=Pleurodeles waltl TaxID=8319 RepID=A0AAV7P8R3_PLEWA|nr:hypothetical protein NDU88_002003 [Pleurodeles waltl]
MTGGAFQETTSWPEPVTKRQQSAEKLQRAQEQEVTRSWRQAIRALTKQVALGNRTESLGSVRVSTLLVSERAMWQIAPLPLMLRTTV